MPNSSAWVEIVITNTLRQFHIITELPLILVMTESVGPRITAMQPDLHVHVDGGNYLGSNRAHGLSREEHADGS